MTSNTLQDRLDTLTSDIALARQNLADVLDSCDELSSALDDTARHDGARHLTAVARYLIRALDAAAEAQERTKLVSIDPAGPHFEIRDPSGVRVAGGWDTYAGAEHLRAALYGPAADTYRILHVA